MRAILILLFFLTNSVFAQNPDIPERPENAGAVIDSADILSPREEELLGQKLKNFTDTTSTAIVAFSVRDIKGYDIADYSVRVAQKWEIGQRGKDNGILIIIKAGGGKGQREVYIATGYGMEEFVPDAVANRIVENILVPHFRKGEYYLGLNRATDVLMGLVSGRFKPEEAAQKKTDSSTYLFLFVGLLFIIFWFVFKYKNYVDYREQQVSTRGLDFWTFVMLSGMMGGRSGRYRDFSSGRGAFGGFTDGGFSGGGGFGGFGGGSFGGGGAGGRW